MRETYGETVCLNYTTESVLYRLKAINTKINMGDIIPIYMICNKYKYIFNTPPQAGAYKSYAPSLLHI